MNGKKWLAAMIAGLILLFGYFVWPTPYRYYVLQDGKPYIAAVLEKLEVKGEAPAASVIVRENRFTGKVEVLFGEWTVIAG